LQKINFEMAKQNVQDRGAQIPKNAASLLVREMPGDAAQQRHWTFCEAINLLLIDNIASLFYDMYKKYKLTIWDNFYA